MKSWFFNIVALGNLNLYCLVFLYCYFNNLFRCLQGLNKSELTRIMLNVLGVRKQACRNLRRRQITKLSPNVQRAFKQRNLASLFGSVGMQNIKSTSPKRGR